MLFLSLFFPMPSEGASYAVGSVGLWHVLVAENKKTPPSS